MKFNKICVGAQFALFEYRCEPISKWNVIREILICTFYSYKNVFESNSQAECDRMYVYRIESQTVGALTRNNVI